MLLPFPLILLPAIGGILFNDRFLCVTTGRAAIAVAAAAAAAATTADGGDDDGGCNGGGVGVCVKFAACC